MNCLWCDAPCSGKLCSECDAVNSGPVFHCDKPRHIPTLGTRCAECQYLEEAAERKRVRNAPIIASLEAIRARHIRDWHKPWPGCEHGKAIIGMSIDAALQALR